MKYESMKITKSKRKSISIKVTDDGLVVVRAPKRVSEAYINSFIKKSSKWIDKKLEAVGVQNTKLKEYKFSKNEISRLKKKAKLVIKTRLDEISEQIGIEYNNFRLSGAKKRWGSCSSKKTISINWRLIFAPPDIIDYVITHELAHLKHMNHSKRFWKLVETYIPNYKDKRKWLNENDFLLRVGESEIKD